LPAWLEVILRGTIVAATYPLLLIALDFYDCRELAFIGRLLTRVLTAPRLRSRRTLQPPQSCTNTPSHLPA
jgi:hypothetical protein